MQGLLHHFFRLLVPALFLFVLLTLFPQITAGKKTAAQPVVAIYTYKVITSYPHDPDAFTQGLAIDQGLLYEGVGRYGLSSLRWVDKLTGKAIKVHTLPRQYFGEGITVFGDKIIQLTWKSHIALVYDKISFERIKIIAYPFEGWGVTHDGSQLITSDGTATIRFLDPVSFKVKRWIEVVDENGPVNKLNELEYVNGVIFANVWHSDRIAIIDPVNGQVKGWLDLSGLLDQKDLQRPIDVLNGIAYDPAKDSLYVTGKLWPRLFEIQPVLLHEKPSIE